MASPSEAQAAPWDAAAPHEQLFVLITGANSGIGLSTGERLIDEFLASRSLTSHLILLPTTRSPTKSKQTVHALRAYALRAAESPKLLSRGDSDAASRIHILSTQLDLCDLRNVHSLAKQLCNGTLSNPEGTEGPDGKLKGIKIPRLDTLIFNAAYGGWSGLNIPLAIWEILTKGIVQSVTWPTFKVAFPTRLLNERPEYKYPAEPLLGEVFTACVFGHYMLARQLFPLLSRDTSSSLHPGRIIWTSSLEAVRDVFDVTDIQGFRSLTPYDGAKRLIDILVLTQSLPSVRPMSATYLAPSIKESEEEDDDDDDELDLQPPRMYVTHPGIVTSTLFPCPWFLIGAYTLVLYIARWLGSPWHTTDAYSGASSASWLTLQEQSALDELDAERVKWGSGTDRRGNSVVKKTEVEGWGWEGRVEDLTDEDGVTGVLRKRIGRKLGTQIVRKGDLMEFEELGAECWEQMEDLREEWSEILDL